MTCCNNNFKSKTGRERQSDFENSQTKFEKAKRYLEDELLEDSQNMINIAEVINSFSDSKREKIKTNKYAYNKIHPELTYNNYSRTQRNINEIHDLYNTLLISRRSTL
jgi:predicted transcriptional regulator